MKKLYCLLAGLLLTVAQGLGAQSVTLAWDASADAASVTNYNIYWGLQGPTNHISTNKTVCGNVLTYTLTNAVSAGNTYWFYATCQDTNNQESWPSNEILYSPGYPTPDRVAGFRYTTYWQGNNPSVLKLDWNPVTNVGLSNYKLYWGTVNTNTGAYLTSNLLLIPPSVLTTNIGGLGNFNTYYFTVSAVSTNAVEGSKSDEIRYYVYPRPPGSPGFRQVITITPQ